MTVTKKVAPEARPVDSPDSGTPPAAAASAFVSTLSPSTASIVNVGAVSATVNLCLVSAETLPLASVACALTVAVPSTSASASAVGIVADQAPLAPTVA